MKQNSSSGAGSPLSPSSEYNAKTPLGYEAPNPSKLSGSSSSDSDLTPSSGYDAQNPLKHSGIGSSGSPLAPPSGYKAQAPHKTHPSFKKMWEGRTAGKTDPAADDFNSSIRFDSKMYRQDVLGSMAHAAMLGAQGIIPTADAEKLAEGLEGILNDLDAGKLEFDPAAEDIHMFVETATWVKSCIPHGAETTRSHLTRGCTCATRARISQRLCSALSKRSAPAQPKTAQR